jgi:hypothetical protein
VERLTGEASKETTMSIVRDLLQRLGSAFGQDLTGTSTIVPGAPGELAAFYAGAFPVSITKAIDAAANTVTASTWMYTNDTPYPMYILSASYVSPAGTVTADNTNFATFVIRTDNGAAGAPADAAQRSTTIAAPGTGNIAAAIKADIITSGTITAANSTARVLPPGGNLWYGITKGGTGFQVPAGSINVVLAKF